MRERIRTIGLPSLVYLSLEESAKVLNPVIRGWIQYYGRFYRTELISNLYRYLDDRIAAWLRQKYKRLRGRRLQSWRLLARIRSGHRDLFAHWRRASEVACGDGSRMTRECHVRFCEHLGGKFPGVTRHGSSG
jgi:hypothetical protein